MSQRSIRVAEAIKREVSDLLLKGGVKDSRLGGSMASITEVEVSGDLRHARIFVSIFGKDADQQQVMEGLKSATGYIRSEIGKRIRLQFTPEIQFELDNSLERGSRVLALMNRIKAEEQQGKHESPDHSIPDGDEA